MLIKALCDYADKREKRVNEKEIPAGWCQQKCSFRIMLTPEGDMDDIVDIREKDTTVDKKGKEKTKLVPSMIMLPERTQKTAIDSNIIEHRPLYIFGLEAEKDTYVVSEKARKSHIAFVKHETAYFAEIDSEVCRAYLAFLEKWKPEEELENPKLLRIIKEYKGAYFCFGLTGGKFPLESDEAFVAHYNSQIAAQQESSASQANQPVCGILGERAATARIHDKITFPGGTTSGCVLVGMKESAYESYGKTQSFNSNISEPAMKKYTATLNMLLADKSHRVMIDDLVIIFFAMKADDANECDWFADFFSDSNVSSTENALSAMMQDVRSGVAGDTNFAIDSNVMFYIAGMTPNSARICQKFLYRNRFGDIIHNLQQHQLDFMVAPDRQKGVTFWQIKRELISPKSSNDKVPPPLMTSLLLAAMNGKNYPETLLETAIRRVKTDSDEENNRFIKLNDTRVGIIKACINRKLRNAGKKEEITMALNPENRDPAYLCGRLFAVYEKIQRDAAGSDLNRTIKDSFFSSACARPAVIMPKLDKLAQNHMRKFESGTTNYWLRMIGEIMNELDGTFPQTLDLDSQGKFIIGYYQQNKALYTAKKTTE